MGFQLLQFFVLLVNRIALLSNRIEGNYYLEIGVTNWLDNAFDSGLAVDGVSVAGVPITPPNCGAKVTSLGVWGAR